MSTKIQPISGMEDTIQTTIAATAPVSSTVSPKVSLFAKKSGFVIPKNKLSGSLVPIFRSGKKPGGTDVESEESSKQVLRKTKWGPDLTQDAFVRKGRASAYQTRLDQITQQLKSRIMEAGPVAHGAAQESPEHHIEKSELELERREVIGEILKLNPSYKAPADYKPLLKEDKFAIPIKEYPERNFIGLIFGPAGDTQKRLEKETGAKIQVYGTKADTRKEIEITSSDGKEAHGDYEELSVLVTAETYEKVDAAVSLIELLVTPVLANTVANSTKDAVSGNNLISPSSNTISPVLVNQGVAKPFTGSGQAPQLARFQPYPNPWPPTGQSSGFITTSNSAAMPSSFGPRTAISAPFGSVALPIHQHTHLHQVPNMGYSGPPRNPSLPPPTGPNQNVRPMGSHVPSFTFPDRPLTPGGWSRPPAHSPGTLGPNLPQIMHPTVRPQPLGNQSSPFRPSSVTPPSPVVPQTGAPIRPPPITSLRPPQPSSNNFTFQTHRPQTPTSQQAPRPGNHPGSHFMPPQNQSLSFRPGMNNHGTPPIMQGLHRPQNSHQMGPSSMQFGPGPSSPASRFPPRPGNFGQVQQNHPSMGFRPQNFLAPLNQQFRGNASYSLGRPGNPSGPRQQIYDPFSPTGAPHKPGNPQNSRKQDNDPEYDDLMASVGVK